MARHAAMQLAKPAIQHQKAARVKRAVKQLAKQTVDRLAQEIPESKSESKREYKKAEKCAQQCIEAEAAALKKRNPAKKVAKKKAKKNLAQPYHFGVFDTLMDVEAYCKWIHELVPFVLNHKSENKHIIAITITKNIVDALSHPDNKELADSFFDTFHLRNTVSAFYQTALYASKNSPHMYDRIEADKEIMNAANNANPTDVNLHYIQGLIFTFKPDMNDMNTVFMKRLVEVLGDSETGVCMVNYTNTPESIIKLTEATMAKFINTLTLTMTIVWSIRFPKSEDLLWGRTDEVDDRLSELGVAVESPSIKDINKVIREYKSDGRFAIRPDNKVLESAKRTPLDMVLCTKKRLERAKDRFGKEELLEPTEKKKPSAGATDPMEAGSTDPMEAGFSNQLSPSIATDETEKEKKKAMGTRDTNTTSKSRGPKDGASKNRDPEDIASKDRDPEITTSKIGATRGGASKSRAPKSIESTTSKDRDPESTTRNNGATKGGASKNRAPESTTSKSRNPESTTRKNGATKGGASEIRATKGGASEIRATKGGASEIRATKDGASEIRATKGGASEIRATKGGASKNNPPKGNSRTSATGDQMTVGDEDQTTQQLLTQARNSERIKQLLAGHYPPQATDEARSEDSEESLSNRDSEEREEREEREPCRTVTDEERRQIIRGNRCDTEENKALNLVRFKPCWKTEPRETVINETMTTDVIQKLQALSVTPMPTVATTPTINPPFTYDGREIPDEDEPDDKQSADHRRWGRDQGIIKYLKEQHLWLSLQAAYDVWVDDLIVAGHLPDLVIPMEGMNTHLPPWEAYPEWAPNVLRPPSPPDGPTIGEPYPPQEVYAALVRRFFHNYYTEYKKTNQTEVPGGLDDIGRVATGDYDNMIFRNVPPKLGGYNTYLNHMWRSMQGGPFSQLLPYRYFTQYAGRRDVNNVTPFTKYERHLVDARTDFTEYPDVDTEYNDAWMPRRGDYR